MSASHLPLAFFFAGVAVLSASLAHHGIEERLGWRGFGWLTAALVFAAFAGSQVAAAVLLVAYD